MPTAIVADDEDLPRSELRSMLARAWPELEVVAECEHGVDALEAIAQQRPDIAFLDIRMPGLSGLDVANALALGGGKCQVVFVTAYEQHALSAFGAGAFDYLLKPVSSERLQRTVARLRERLAGPGPGLAAAVDLGGEIDRHLRRGDVAPLRWISASAGDCIKMIPIAKVLFFESDAKYTRVVTRDDEAHVRMSLKELHAGLEPESFWQLNRGLLVRADAIQRARRDELGRYSVELDGCAERLKVSAAYSWRFRAM